MCILIHVKKDLVNVDIVKWQLTNKMDKWQ